MHNSLPVLLRPTALLLNAPESARAEWTDNVLDLLSLNSFTQLVLAFLRGYLLVLFLFKPLFLGIMRLLDNEWAEELVDDAVWHWVTLHQIIWHITQIVDRASFDAERGGARFALEAAGQPPKKHRNRACVVKLRQSWRLRSIELLCPLLGFCAALGKNSKLRTRFLSKLHFLRWRESTVECLPQILLRHC